MNARARHARTGMPSAAMDLGKIAILAGQLIGYAIMFALLGGWTPGGLS